MANLKTSEKKTKAQSMGLHTEVLTGKTQQKFFNPDEAENFYYFGTHDVDFNKRTEIDVKDMDCKEANRKIDELMSQGYGTIVVKNPQGKHSLGVGILNKLNLIYLIFLHPNYVFLEDFLSQLFRSLHSLICLFFRLLLYNPYL